jgi:hypothetical protein
MSNLCKNPIVLSLVAGVVAAIISYIDHKVNSEDEFTPDYTRYFKILVLVSGLSYGVLNLSCRGCPFTKQTGGGEGAPWGETTVGEASSVVEPIHTGNPNF